MSTASIAIDNFLDSDKWNTIQSGISSYLNVNTYTNIGDPLHSQIEGWIEEKLRSLNLWQEPWKDEIKLFHGINVLPEGINVESSDPTNGGYHREDGGVSGVGYDTVSDDAQSTSFLNLIAQVGNANDESCSGYLHLFNPSSTTFVKHFISNMNMAAYNDYSFNVFKGGYFNTTSAIDAIQFKQSADEIQGGDICLYGIN